jgi:hypothetical protein
VACGEKRRASSIAITIGVRISAAPSLAEQRRHRRAEQNQQHEQLASIAAAPARHMQRGPFEEAGLVEYQADDDDRDESGRRIPDDVPDHRNIGEVNHAAQQREHGTEARAPTDAETARLPDDERERQQKNKGSSKHDDKK